MLILGATSEVAENFIEIALTKGEKYQTVYLLTIDEAESKKFAQHLTVKYQQKCEVIFLDLMTNSDFSFIQDLTFNTVFCAMGYLGKNTQEGLYDTLNSQRILEINYSKLVPLLNIIAEKLEKKGSGDIIVLSSVAGDRGRQSNFMYGSAKAGLTAYLSGLRNYLAKKNVHVMTVLPGFMATRMTAGMDLPKPLTASAKDAAIQMFKGYKKKRNILYVSPIWELIMLVIRNIPEFIFKKLNL